MIGVPILLLAVFAWQIASPIMRTEIAVRSAVGFSRVSLEADPAGSRIDFAVVDRVGQEPPDRRRAVFHSSRRALPVGPLPSASGQV